MGGPLPATDENDVDQRHREAAGQPWRPNSSPRKDKPRRYSYRMSFPLYNGIIKLAPLAHNDKHFQPDKPD